MDGLPDFGVGVVALLFSDSVRSSFAEIHQYPKLGFCLLNRRTQRTQSGGGGSGLVYWGL